MKSIQYLLSIVLMVSIIACNNNESDNKETSELEISTISNHYNNSNVESTYRQVSRFNQDHKITFGARYDFQEPSEDVEFTYTYSNNKYEWDSLERKYPNDLTRNSSTHYEYIENSDGLLYQLKASEFNFNMELHSSSIYEYHYDGDGEFISIFGDDSHGGSSEHFFTGSKNSHSFSHSKTKTYADGAVTTREFSWVYDSNLKQLTTINYTTGSDRVFFLSPYGYSKSIYFFSPADKLISASHSRGESENSSSLYQVIHFVYDNQDRLDSSLTTDYSDSSESYNCSVDYNDSGIPYLFSNERSNEIKEVIFDGQYIKTINYYELVSRSLKTSHDFTFSGNTSLYQTSINNECSKFHRLELQDYFEGIDEYDLNFWGYPSF